MDLNNILLSYAVKKVDKSIKLNDFPHITGKGKWVTTKDGIVAHGCFHKPAGIGADVSLIWGNYYIGALLKLKEYKGDLR